MSFMQDVTAGIQKQQRAKGLWHFTVSPSMGMTHYSIDTDCRHGKDVGFNAASNAISADVCKARACCEEFACSRSQQLGSHGICLEYCKATEQDACCSKERQAFFATASSRNLTDITFMYLRAVETLHINQGSECMQELRYPSAQAE